MRAALLALLLVTALAATPAVGAGAAGSTDIVRSATVSLTPHQPGSVHANVSYSLPDGLRTLSVTPGPYMTVRSAHGFTENGGSYTWDGHTAHPSLSIREEVNRSYAEHANGDTRQGYSFAATPTWAIAPVPTMQTSWTWTGAGHVTLKRVANVRGQGATGGEIAYLGPYQSYNATGAGQHFRLIVPKAASPVADPHDVLSALVDAARRLRVGDRDGNVFFVAAPASVAWGPAGLEYGGSDAWVEADQRLKTPGDTWVHEYVHTRQAYQPTTTTQWTIEATAVYESTLIDLESGRIDFRQFRDSLARGEDNRYATAVLSNPASWGSALVPYTKGALAVGNLDYRIRAAGDGSFADVLGRLNAHQGAVTQSAFLDAVGAVGNKSTAETARRWTETSDTPGTWTDRQHDRVFDTTPSRIDVTFPQSGFRVSGPTRNATTSHPPTLVTGETLNATVLVANAGGETGNYSIALRKGNATIEQRGGSLAPGENASVAVSHTFTQPGTYTLDAGYRTVDITVEPPAKPTVTGVSVSPGDVAPGGRVNVSVTATNPASLPAKATVPVTLDGRRVTSVSVALPPGGSTTKSVSVSVPNAGTHTVGADDHEATVRAATPARTSTTSPGFSVLAGIVGLAAAAGLLASRRR